MKITVTNLGKRFNREWIFKNLQYQFEAGKTYAVIGPNGSGKSTLLQILWGQVPPSTGKLQYEESNLIIAPEDIFRKIAIATSYMELIEEFTLAEMIAFHFKFKQTRNQISLTDILEKLELAHAADKLVSNFSSGMRQRLKLGLALFSETSILFLDEPTTNLDKKSIDWYWKHLTQLPSEMMVFIASNQDHEYPESAIKVNILDYKQVTSTPQKRLTKNP